jgi:hypothetical protein
LRLVAHFLKLLHNEGPTVEEFAERMNATGFVQIDASGTVVPYLKLSSSASRLKVDSSLTALIARVL